MVRVCVLLGFAECKVGGEWCYVTAFHHKFGLAGIGCLFIRWSSQCTGSVKQAASHAVARKG
jgi:hypothetical protein